MRNLPSGLAALTVNLAGDLSDQALKLQLKREIASLERQLFRLQTRNDVIDYNSLQTYQEMLLSRQRTLESLSWDE